MLMLPFLAAAFVQTPAGETASPKDPAPLFASLAGQWSCAGAFADGKPLEADLRFEKSLDGRALRYTHVDRAPNVYLQDSSWGLDKETGELVSMPFIAFRPERGASANLYVADTWSADQVTFVHRKLLKEPWAPNRFTYTVKAGKLKMVWEVQQQGAWKMGDYLDCTRKG